jgi:prepilin-type N-terminal cleavage/methylation domain-containing protein
MKRCVKGLQSLQEHGFSLIELVVVAGVISILLVIGGLSMRSMLGKARVEEEIKRMYTDLTDARTRAMNRNRVHFARVTAAANQYQIWEDTSPPPDGDGSWSSADTKLSQVITTDQIVSALGTITFDTRGLISPQNGTIQIVNNFGSVVDCIAISTTKMRLGRLIGANCVSQ